MPTKIILNNNEIIMKEILPRKSFFFNMTEKIRIVFSCFYLAVSVLFLTNIRNSEFVLFSLIAIFLFCSALYITFFRWIVRYFRLRNYYYVITSQRIIIATKESGKIIKYKKIEEINQINDEMNTKFFGNIIFGEPENIFGKNNEPFSFFGKRGMNFSEDKYAFTSVDNINEIIPVFEKLGLKVSKTFY